MLQQKLILMIKEQTSFFLKRVIVRAEKSDSRLSNAPKPYSVLPEEETAVLLLPAQSHDLTLNHSWGRYPQSSLPVPPGPMEMETPRTCSPCSSLPIHPAKVKYTQPNGEEAGNLRFDELFLQI